jgi:hypothetical protein
MASSHASSQRPVRKFKGVTVIEWDTEPAEERPSQFADSTLYADLLGSPPPRSQRSRRSTGIGSAWFALVLVLAVASGGMFGLMKFLHA